MSKKVTNLTYLLPFHPKRQFRNSDDLNHEEISHHLLIIVGKQSSGNHKTAVPFPQNKFEGSGLSAGEQNVHIQDFMG